jgi:hypothetical protein
LQLAKLQSIKLDMLRTIFKVALKGNGVVLLSRCRTGLGTNLYNRSIGAVRTSTIGTLAALPDDSKVGSKVAATARRMNVTKTKVVTSGNVHSNKDAGLSLQKSFSPVKLSYLAGMTEKIVSKSTPTSAQEVVQTAAVPGYFKTGMKAAAVPGYFKAGIKAGAVPGYFKADIKAAAVPNYFKAGIKAAAAAPRMIITKPKVVTSARSKKDAGLSLQHLKSGVKVPHLADMTEISVSKSTPTSAQKVVQTAAVPGIKAAAVPDIKAAAVPGSFKAGIKTAAAAYRMVITKPKVDTSAQSNKDAGLSLQQRKSGVKMPYAAGMTEKIVSKSTPTSAQVVTQATVVFSDSKAVLKAAAAAGRVNVTKAKVVSTVGSSKNARPSLQQNNSCVKLPYLADMTEKIGSRSTPMSAQEVAQALFSIRSFPPETPGLLELADALVAKAGACVTALTGAEAVKYMGGFTALKVDGPHVKKLLSALLANMEEKQPELDGRAICYMVLGLRGLPSESVEVGAFLRFLEKQLAKMKSSPLSSDLIIQALIVLQNMSNKRAAVIGISDMLMTMLPQPAHAKPTSSFRVRGIDVHEFNVAPTMYAYSLSGHGTMLHSHFPDIGNIVSHSRRMWSAMEISCLLYGIQSATDRNKSGIIKFLETLVVKAKQSTDAFGSSDIARSLVGLSALNETDSHVVELLSLLLTKAKQCPTSFHADEISTSLHALHGLTSNSTEVRALLDYFCEQLKQSGLLSPEQIGMALYGMKNMSTDHAEVRSIVSVLAVKVSETTGEFTPGCISMSLRGLHNMCSQYSEVVEIMDALAPKVRTCSEQFTGPQIGDSFKGLSSMRSRDACTLQIIDALNKKSVNLSTVSGHDIVNILSGLKSFGGEPISVRKALSQLHPMLKTARPKMTPKTICSSFECMSNFDNSCEGAIRIVGTLVEAATDHQDSEWSASMVSDALRGLRCMDFKSPVVLSALVALTYQLARSTGELSIKRAALIVEPLAKRNKSIHYPEVRKLLAVIAGKLTSGSPEAGGSTIVLALHSLLEKKSPPLTRHQISEALCAINGHGRVTETTNSVSTKNPGKPLIASANSTAVSRNGGR